MSEPTSRAWSLAEKMTPGLLHRARAPVGVARIYERESRYAAIANFTR